MIRTKRVDVKDSQPYTSKQGIGKQRTLESLSGVVVIEDIKKYKVLLENCGTSADKKIDILKKLNQKSPATQILIDTAIGKTVNRLRKSQNSEVAESAEILYNNWKQILERRVELSSTKIEVKFDRETERVRSASRKFIETSLNNNQVRNCKQIAEEFEKQVYLTSNKRVGKVYRKLSRKLVFELKNQKYSDICFDSQVIKTIIKDIHS